MGAVGSVASDAPASIPDDTGYRPDIQGLRAVAVLLIVLFHADVVFRGGFVGVDVFFVVSGFVIARMLMREMTATGSVRMGGFYARRVRRLLPSLALVSIVTMVVSIVMLSPRGPQQLTAKTAVAASMFVANLFLYKNGGGYFDLAETSNPMLHTWSLSVEEQFYLILPLLFVVVWRTAGRRARVGEGHRRPTPSPQVRAVVAALAATTATSLALSWFFTARGSERLAFYMPFTRLWEISAGAIVALLSLSSPSFTKFSVRVAAALAIVGGAAILFAALLFDEATPFPGVAALVPVGGAVALLVAGGASASVARPLGWWPLTWIGDLSYSWYLWHWPAIVLVHALWPANHAAVVVAAFASLGPAAAAHRFVENPFRTNKAIVGLRALRLGAICVLVPVLVAGFMLVGADRSWGLPGAEAAKVAQTDTEIARRRCSNPCVVKLPGSTGKLFFVGDSHAGALADSVHAVATAGNADYGVWTKGGCAVLSKESTGPDCVAWQRSVLDWIVREKPDVVVMTAYTTGRVTTTNSGATVPLEMRDEKGRVAASEMEALDMYRAGLDHVLTELQKTGTKVVLLSTTPDFPTDPFIDEFSMLHPEPVGASVAVAEARQRNQGVLDAEREVAARYPFVAVVDPLPLLCGDICSQLSDGEWIYRDTDHLSLAGGRRLEAPLTAAVAQLRGS